MPRAPASDQGGRRDVRQGLVRGAEGERGKDSRHMVCKGSDRGDPESLGQQVRREASWVRTRSWWGGWGGLPSRGDSVSHSREGGGRRVPGCVHVRVRVSLSQVPLAPRPRLGLQLQPVDGVEMHFALSFAPVSILCSGPPLLLEMGREYLGHLRAQPNAGPLYPRVPSPGARGSIPEACLEARGPGRPRLPLPTAAPQWCQAWWLSLPPSLTCPGLSAP